MKRGELERTFRYGRAVLDQAPDWLSPAALEQLRTAPEAAAALDGEWEAIEGDLHVRALAWGEGAGFGGSPRSVVLVLRVSLLPLLTPPTPSRPPSTPS